ncbi:MAG: hypothetical protein Q4Q62_07765 [Thermoplasmata archaeon]|nr:hypothetical protein [Thermoplasmata archaeon]
MKARTVAAAVIVALLAVALVPCAMDDSDAASTANIGDNKASYTFDSRDGGSITFTIENEGSAFTINVTVKNSSGSTVGSASDVAIAATSTTTVTVNMSGFTSVGTHNVTVNIEVASGSASLNATSFSTQIVVNQNILTNWVTYVVLIVIIIVIAVLVYLRIRDSPKNKTEMTFEQLEEQRKAEMAAKSDKKKAKEPAPTTERQRYLANKKKKE